MAFIDLEGAEVNDRVTTPKTRALRILTLLPLAGAVASTLYFTEASQAGQRDPEFDAAFEECMKLPSPSAAIDCVNAANRKARPTKPIDSARPATSIVGDCFKGRGECSFVWAGIEVVIAVDSSTAWFEVPREFEYGKEPTRWHMICEKDRMSDKRLCLLKPMNAPSVLVSYNGASRAISVDDGGAGFPGSIDQVRIDRNAPLSTRNGTAFSGKSAAVLLAQMKRGNVIYSRFRDWPYNHIVDRQTSLEKFSIIVQVADAIAAQTE